jgi:hypothetical protein
MAIFNNFLPNGCIRKSEMGNKLVNNPLGIGITNKRSNARRQHISASFKETRTVAWCFFDRFQFQLRQLGHVNKPSVSKC